MIEPGQIYTGYALIPDSAHTVRTPADTRPDSSADSPDNTPDKMPDS